MKKLSVFGIIVGPPYWLQAPFSLHWSHEKKMWRYRLTGPSVLRRGLSKAAPAEVRFTF
jgi:hypothetical protein